MSVFVDLLWPVDDPKSVEQADGGPLMVRAGALLPLVSWIGPGRLYEHAVFVAARPSTASAPTGTTRKLAVGDVYMAAEVAHAGGGMRGACLRGEVIELDATTGLPAAYNALALRCNQLERLLRETLPRDEGAA
jgi:hypothetical protein